MRWYMMLMLLPCVVRAESIWIEAEHLAGIKGYCWPSGRPEMKKTDGHWAISGPGWAAEWIQGGESGFLSIACAADDDRAKASTTLDIPTAGKYRVWVRFRENREMTNRFQVRLTAAGKPTTLTYGTKPNLDEDNEMKLYWNWAFAWEGHDLELPKGNVQLELLAGFKEKEARQIDCLVLTTDLAYRPQTKERPTHPTRALLDSLRQEQRTPNLAKRQLDGSVPPAWQPRTFRDQGFLYLWNMNQVKWAENDPQRVPVPYHIADKETREAFEKKYAGQRDVPIFGDPRLVPVFHGVGPYYLEPTTKDGKPNPKGQAFLQWLAADPKRKFGHLLNYHPDTPTTPEGHDQFIKYRDRFVGSISGENLGYFNIKPADLKATVATAKNRRELAEAITKVCLAANEEKYRTVYGRAWPDAYKEVIPCESVGMTAFAPLCYSWGARTVGFESSAITSALLAMRMAFLRGAARQHGAITATYRSCNFGDSATIFSEQSAYTMPKNILDNYYSVYSGAGMTWYKMDVWHQYFSGSGLFYHEQGFDEFWRPGGTTAAGLHEVQLSPKGKIVDRFLRVTAKNPDRGAPYTPVAFLLDYAHGWEPSPYQPHAFNDFAQRPELTAYGDHERMLQEYFWTAYHPIGTRAEQPTTATSEFIVPGVFGDLFDVVFAYPDVKKWTTLNTYPAVVIAGDISLTEAEGKRLAAYVEAGGTLLLAEGHLSGPGVAALALPTMGPVAEGEGYQCQFSKKAVPTQRFRYRPLEGGQPLATTDGKTICASYDRGQGRLIVLAVPRGLGIDRTAHPLLARLFAQLTRGSTPFEVQGEVEWLLNRTAAGWIVTLLNSAGQLKPQQGITPTDYRENRTVTLRTTRPVKRVTDWLMPEESFMLKAGELTVTVPAGSVRVLEFRE